MLFLKTSDDIDMKLRHKTRSLTCDLLPIPFELACLMREKREEVDGEMGQVIWTLVINVA